MKIYVVYVDSILDYTIEVSSFMRIYCLPGGTTFLYLGGTKYGKVPGYIYYACYAWCPSAPGFLNQAIGLQ
jgi:hypothetical protein